MSLANRLCLLVFVLAFAITLAWLWPLYLLFDSDSSYHLAVAREYWQQGLLHGLPWARFSAMRDGFGDKELLFHVLLAPLTATPDVMLGGKLGLAALVAVNCACLFRVAWPALGRQALYLPALIVCGSLSFDLRLIRLRPELGALLLFMSCLGALAYERYVLLWLLSWLFAWSYTAVHVLVGLCTVSFAYAFWREHRPRYGMLVAPWAGAVLGLLTHPQFPANLRVFYLQNVVFWSLRDQSDMGDEIRAMGLGQFLRFDAPALLGAVLLMAAVTRRSQSAPDLQLVSGARVFSLAALVFGGLFVSGARFALYAWPFALLAFAYQAAARGYCLAPRLSRLGERAARTWLPLSLLGVIAAPHTYDSLTHIADVGGCVWPPQRRQLERFGRALPAGAKVAAPWTVSEEYVLFAPQGRYLNLLDPVFMRSAHPREYWLQRRLFQAEVLDVPLALLALDSDYLAFSDRSLPRLAAQVSGDPRLLPEIAHGQVLYRLQPGLNRSFVLDYLVAQQRAALSGGAARPYPRASDAGARAIEGIVDGQRVGAAGRCLWFAPRAQLDPAACWELGSTGTLSVYRGPARIAQVPATASLVLGQGSRIRLPQSASAPAPLALQLCSGAEAASFYLLQRGCAPAQQAGATTASN